MDAVVGALALLVGIVLVVISAERFVEGLLGSALTLGASTFGLSIVFGGFDPDNLGAGAASLLNDLPTVAMGTVIGSAIFLLTAGLGIAAILAPLSVQVPRRYAVLTLLAPLPLLALMLDKRLSRIDGIILLVLFAPLLAYIMVDAWRSRAAYIASEEAAEVDEERASKPALHFPALLAASLGLLAVGAWLIGWGAKTIVEELEVSQTLFGMVFLSAAVSLEEVARGAIPALRGHPEISIGNVVGTILFFVLFNVGLLALIRPIRVEEIVISLHWPFMMGVLAVTSLFILRKRIGRLEGASLLGLYGIYLALTVVFR